jgi:hypothetical protein
MKKISGIFAIILSVITLSLSVLGMDNDPDLTDFAVVSYNQNTYALEIDGFFSDNISIKELLFSFLTKYPHLRKLRISNITLDAESIDSLSQIIQNKPVNTIELVAVNLDDQALERVTELLNTSNKLLQHVNLSDNSLISCHALRKFGSEIQDAKHLRSLCFDKCKQIIPGQGIATAFRSMIEQNPEHELQLLKLPFNHDKSLRQEFDLVKKKNDVKDGNRKAKREAMNKAWVVLADSDMSIFETLPHELRDYIIYFFVKVNPIY